jgi:hypothetical protein
MRTVSESVEWINRMARHCHEIEKGQELFRIYSDGTITEAKDFNQILVPGFSIWQIHLYPELSFPVNHRIGYLNKTYAMTSSWDLAICLRKRISQEFGISDP